MGKREKNNPQVVKKRDHESLFNGIELPLNDQIDRPYLISTFSPF